MAGNAEYLLTKYNEYYQAAQHFFATVAEGLIGIYQQIVDTKGISPKQRKSAAAIIEHIYDNMVRRRSYFIHENLSTHSLVATDSILYFDIANLFCQMYANVKLNIEKYDDSAIDADVYADMLKERGPLAMRQSRLQSESALLIRRLEGCKNIIDATFIEHVVNLYYKLYELWMDFYNSMPVPYAELIFSDSTSDINFKRIVPSNPMRYLKYLRRSIEHRSVYLGEQKLQDLLQGLMRKDFYGDRATLHLDLAFFGGLLTDKLVEKILILLRDKVLSLDLSKSRVTDSIWAVIAKYAPNLRRLVLAGNDYISLSQPKKAVLSSVELLDISDCHNLNGFNVELPKLRYLTIGGGEALRSDRFIGRNADFIRGLRHYFLAKERVESETVIELIVTSEFRGILVAKQVKQLCVDLATNASVSLRIALFDEILAEYSDFEVNNELLHADESYIEMKQNTDFKALLGLCKSYACSYDLGKRKLLLYSIQIPDGMARYNYRSNNALIPNSRDAFSSLLRKSGRTKKEPNNISYFVFIMRALSELNSIASDRFLAEAIDYLIHQAPLLAADVILSVVSEDKNGVIFRSIKHSLQIQIESRYKSVVDYTVLIIQSMRLSRSNSLQRGVRQLIDYYLANIENHSWYYMIVKFLLINWLGDSDPSVNRDAKSIINGLTIRSTYSLAAKSLVATVIRGVLQLYDPDADVIGLVDDYLENLVHGTDDQRMLAGMIIANYDGASDERISTKGQSLLQRLTASNNIDDNSVAAWVIKLNVLLERWVFEKRLPQYIISSSDYLWDAILLKSIMRNLLLMSTSNEQVVRSALVDLAKRNDVELSISVLRFLQYMATNSNVDVQKAAVSIFVACHDNGNLPFVLINNDVITDCVESEKPVAPISFFSDVLNVALSLNDMRTVDQIRLILAGYVSKYKDGNAYIVLAKIYLWAVTNSVTKLLQLGWQDLLWIESSAECHRIMLEAEILRQISSEDKNTIMANCGEPQKLAQTWGSLLSTSYDDLTKEKINKFWQLFALVENNEALQAMVYVTMEYIDSRQSSARIAKVVVDSLIHPHGDADAELRVKFVRKLFDIYKNSDDDIRHEFFGMVVGRIVIKRDFVQQSRTVFADFFKVEEITSELVQAAQESENEVVVQSMCDRLISQKENIIYSPEVVSKFMLSPVSTVRDIGFATFRKIVGYKDKETGELASQLVKSLFKNGELPDEIRNNLESEIEFLIFSDDEGLRSIGKAIMHHSFNSSTDYLTYQKEFAIRLLAKWAQARGDGEQRAVSMLLQDIVENGSQLYEEAERAVLVIQIAMTGGAKTEDIVRSHVKSMLKSENVMMHSIVAKAINSTLVRYGSRIQEMAYEFIGDYLQAGKFLHLLLPEAKDIQQYDQDLSGSTVASALRICAEMDDENLRELARTRLHEYYQVQHDKGKNIVVGATLLLAGSKQGRVRQMAHEVVNDVFKNDKELLITLYRKALRKQPYDNHYFNNIEQEHHFARDFAVSKIMRHIRVSGRFFDEGLVNALCDDFGAVENGFMELLTQCIQSQDRELGPFLHTVFALVTDRVGEEQHGISALGTRVAAIIGEWLGNKETYAIELGSNQIERWSCSKDSKVRSLAVKALVSAIKSTNESAHDVASSWLLESARGNNGQKHDVAVNMLADLLGSSHGSVEDKMLVCMQQLLLLTSEHVVPILTGAINKAWFGNSLNASSYSNKLINMIKEQAESNNHQAVDLLLWLINISTKVDSTCNARWLVPSGKNKCIVPTLVVALEIDIGRVLVQALVAIQQYAGLSKKFKKQMVSALYSGKITKSQLLLRLGKELLQTYASNNKQVKASFLLQQLILDCVKSDDGERQMIAAELFCSCLQAELQDVDKSIACILIELSKHEAGCRLTEVILSQCSVHELYLVAKVITLLDPNSYMIAESDVLIEEASDSVKAAMAQLLMRLIQVDNRTNLVTFGLMFCHVKEIIDDVNKVLDEMDQLFKGVGFVEANPSVRP